MRKKQKNKTVDEVFASNASMDNLATTKDNVEIGSSDNSGITLQEESGITLQEGRIDEQFNSKTQQQNLTANNIEQVEGQLEEAGNIQGKDVPASDKNGSEIVSNEQIQDKEMSSNEDERSNSTAQDLSGEKLSRDALIQLVKAEEGLVELLATEYLESKGGYIVPPVLSGGTYIESPPLKVKSLKEAGRLFLKSINN